MRGVANGKQEVALGMWPNYFTGSFCSLSGTGADDSIHKSQSPLVKRAVVSFANGATSFSSAQLSPGVIMRDA